MIIKGIKKVREYWKSCMSSAHNKISRGAEYLSKMRPHAKGENWRTGSHRHDDKK